MLTGMRLHKPIRAPHWQAWFFTESPGCAVAGDVCRGCVFPQFRLFHGRASGSAIDAATAQGRWISVLMMADSRTFDYVTLGSVEGPVMRFDRRMLPPCWGESGNMPSVYTEDVARLLERFRPASILQLDPEDTELFSRYLQANPACEIEHLGRSDIIAQLKGKGRYAFSFVANTLEHLDKEAAGQVIAKLRDIHSERLFVVVPMGNDWEGLASTWELSDFVAFGMRLMSSYTTDGKRLQMYKFDISDYKDTPDWLSSKHWAHPERWDKERW